MAADSVTPAGRPGRAAKPKPQRLADRQGFIGADGERGRTTGLKVPPKQRDSEGFENPNDFFSSASKAPTTANSKASVKARPTRKSLDTTLTSEDMDVQESSGPEPSEVLSAANSKRPKLPPAGRSPLKTSLGTPAKRHSSIGPGSSRSIERSRRLTGGNLSEAGGDVYDLEPTPSRSPGRHNLKNHLVNGAGSHEEGNTVISDINGAMDHESMPPPPLDDDDGPPNDSMVNGETEDSQVELSIEGEEEVDAANGDAPEDDANQSQDEGLDGPENEPENQPAQHEAEAEQKPKKSRGRPPKKNKPQTSGEENKQKGSKPGRRAALSNKDNLAKAKPSAQDKNAMRKPGAVQGLQRERHQTPFEDDNAAHTRSGRTTLKPLQYWKGERCVFNLSDRAINEIIHMEDVTPVKRQHSRATSAKPRRRKRRKVNVFEDEESSEDEENSVETWENESGVVSGPVKVWDPETGGGSQESRDEELAFAGQSIEARDVAGSEFRYAKLLSMPFFGSGIVELPPGGFKRAKNSRRMQMMFFVHFGKVVVKIAQNEFTITKGGVWQVPRGNMYSISNPHTRPAKIFFSQGCEVLQSHVAQDDAHATTAAATAANEGATGSGDGGSGAAKGKKGKAAMVNGGGKAAAQVDESQESVENSEVMEVD
ncbi:MAG: hypothetical protein M1831_006946 [Alyxoria varia]|nr:MAG: hypothetical protein M1831_006946 [Alyxoria varia]